MTLDKWYYPAMHFGAVTMKKFAIVILAGICAPAFLLGTVWVGAEMVSTLTVTDSTQHILDDDGYRIAKIEHASGPVDCITFVSRSINDPMDSSNAKDVGLLTPEGTRKIVLTSFGKGERDCSADSFAVVLDDPK